MTRIRLFRDGAIGRVVLARPEKKNALDRQAADRLVRGLDSRLAGAGPAHPVNVRRTADHHQVGVGDNLRPGV